MTQFPYERASNFLDGPLSGRVKVIHAWLVGGAIFDGLILAGFHAAGYVQAWTPLAYAAGCAIVFGAVTWAHHTGRSQRCKDQTLYLPQTLVSLLSPFVVGLTAPQIGFISFVMLFTTSVYGSLAKGKRLFAFSWGLLLSVMTLLVLIRGPELSIPTSTLAGTVLTCIALVGATMRLLGSAVFTRTLQARIRNTNRELNAALERIKELASTDELTELPNRRSMLQWLREQTAYCNRTELSLSVALLDIDHFKRINDVCGHQIGDQVLHMFATRASAAIRVTDRLGRYGGEEFLVVLPATSLSEAKDVLERIRFDIESSDWTSIDSRLRVTVTGGVTEYCPGESLEALVARTDAALYRGKEYGRNRVVLDGAEASALEADWAEQARRFAAR